MSTFSWWLPLCNSEFVQNALHTELFMAVAASATCSTPSKSCNANSALPASCVGLPSVRQRLDLGGHGYGAGRELVLLQLVIRPVVSIQSSSARPDAPLCTSRKRDGQRLLLHESLSRPMRTSYLDAPSHPPP